MAVPSATSLIGLPHLLVLQYHFSNQLSLLEVFWLLRLLEAFCLDLTGAQLGLVHSTALASCALLRASEKRQQNEEPVLEAVHLAAAAASATVHAWSEDCVVSRLLCLDV